MVHKTPPKNNPEAVATAIGWAHEKTGEQLVSVRGLEAVAGTEDYRPNSPTWMAEFQAGSAATVPANTVLPSIAGTTALGDTLTAANGTWTGTPAPTYAYQWTRGGVDIAGAASATHVIVAEDQGTDVAVKVTATNTAGSASAVSAGTAVPAAA